MQPTPRLSREEQEAIDRVTDQARKVRARFAREMDELIRDLARLKGRRPAPPPETPRRGEGRPL